MQYTFKRTDEGVINDNKVASSVAKLDKLESNANLTIEAGYKGTHNAYCKITGLDKPIMAHAEKVGFAVKDAVDTVVDLVRNEHRTARDKNEHAHKKAVAKEREVIVPEADEEDYGLGGVM